MSAGLSTTPAFEETGIGPARRRSLWVLSNTAAIAALAAASLFAFFTTWLFLSPSVDRIDRAVLIAMIVVNVVIATILIGQVSLRLRDVWKAKRDELAGARTHLQLVGIFSIVAAVPAVLAFLYAFTILRTSLDDIFSNRMDGYLQTTLNFTNDFFNDEATDALRNLRQIEGDLKGDAEILGVTPSRAPILFRNRLEQQARARSLAGLLVLDADRRIIARVAMPDVSLTLPPARSFDEVDEAAAAGKSSEWLIRHDLNDARAIDMYRALLKIEAYGGGYLLSYKAVPPVLSERLRAIRDMRDDWLTTKEGRSRIERVFFASYILLAIIILTGAIWLALWAAKGLVQPIGRLVRMADRVSAGDLGARVDVHRSDGELGVLARSMNHMTAQLQTQRDDLIETNRQFDQRRRFTEAVLSGVSAGVIGVSEDGRVTIANRSAADLLGAAPETLTGAAIAEIVPEVHDLFVSAADDPDIDVADQIEIERQGKARTLNVRIATDRTEDRRSFVMTFDDITQLIAAQRSAAWGDVARRIAHEIKNPLTPIQLSAERLKRKYRGEIQSAPEIFDRCIDTIVRHVNDIGRMVDEFSSFARMPKPVIGVENVFELVKTAVFPQRVAFPEIAFVTTGPSEPLFSECDGRLIMQALANIIKNAGESIGARLAADGALAPEAAEGTAETAPPPVPGKIRIEVSRAGDSVRIDVIDNGVGLPEAERHRLTEPYMTTRAKGTGLGLAIVKKVMEEHAGSLAFEDDRTLGPTGARMTLTLPISEQRAAASPAAPARAAERAL